MLKVNGILHFFAIMLHVRFAFFCERFDVWSRFALFICLHWICSNVLLNRGIAICLHFFGIFFSHFFLANLQFPGRNSGKAGKVQKTLGHLQKNTLLRVIPTMTFIHLLIGKSSGILPDISSGILSGILSGISSGISSGILSGISSGICSGISSGISSGILSGISSGILSDISSGILSGILSGISSGISSGILSGKYSGILSVISSGILSDILSGTSIWHISWHFIWHIFWQSI